MILVRRLETSMVSKMFENLILEESWETGFEESTIVFDFCGFVNFGVCFSFAIEASICSWWGDTLLCYNKL